MQLPVQITLRDIPHSANLESHIYEKANKLNLFYEKIMACRVVVELTQKHQHQGKQFNVRIDLTVPGNELVITRNRNEDMSKALREAFDDAKRQIENFVDRLHVKGRVRDNHRLPLHGHVTRIFQRQGYGFIETPDGHEVYFHQCSVLKPRFNQLKVGSEVSFLEEMGEKGPQAARVRMRPHLYQHAARAA